MAIPTPWGTDSGARGMQNLNIAMHKCHATFVIKTRVVHMHCTNSK
jgi:hypothetical protein